MLLTLALVLLPLACGPSGPSPEQQRIEQLELAQQRLERERQREISARQEAEARSSRWQFLTIVAGMAGVLLLVIGAAMGARARRDAEKQGPRHG